MGKKRLGVVGDPLEHSLSPALFAFLLGELGLPYRYEAFHVEANGLPGFLRRVRAEGIAGLNVTIPHKERVIPLLDALDERVRALGAVNTIVNVEGKLVGHNTDVLGFARPLRERGIALAGERAVVLGAGGAARAVVHALVELNVMEITLSNRTVERAERLAARVASQTGFERVCVVPWDAPSRATAISGAKLLVNATSVGMRPRVDESPLGDPSVLHRELIVYDLVYNPRETKLLREAKGRGARTVDGLDMLIQQGLEALRIWTQQEPPRAGALAQRARAHLQGDPLDVGGCGEVNFRGSSRCSSAGRAAAS